MDGTGILKIGVSRFLYGKGVIQQLPDEILRYGSKAFMVGGKTTLPLVRGLVDTQMREKKIAVVWVIMDEPNSVDFAKRLAADAGKEKAEVIVAIGGGKCMDLCKVFSDLAGLPLITVPTSVATCAGASAVSIMYTKEEGRYDCSIPKEKEVDSVLADLDIIGKSPKRLFASGIMDSIAKLPEIVNGRKEMDYPEVTIYKYMAYANSRFIYKFLTENGLKVYQNPEADERLLTDLVLINLIITSMVSGFSSGSDQLAVAHGLYDGTRMFFPEESKGALHGEIVAVGILMQMRFNGDPEEEYQNILSMMKEMNMPTKLKNIGVEPTEGNVAKLREYNIMKNNIVHEDDLKRLNLAFQEII
ncbi:iron-containing alcohol dehydrogenase [Faecalicatena orotica]|uniref:iron-containing alcohol dehydrogenase n=1 Tax=Faecalicatena orotica TaxID=1544 RepID=UPI003216ACB1